MKEKEIDPKLQLIQSIRVLLKDVTVKNIVARLQYSKQNLYKHLDEVDYEKANLEELDKILDAINAEKRAMEKRAAKKLKSMHSKINAS